MSDTRTVSVQVGPGFPALLTLLFIALKLTDVIDWSWLWVLSPIWISMAVAGVFVTLALIIVGIVAGASALTDSRRTRRRKKCIQERQALKNRL